MRQKWRACSTPGCPTLVSDQEPCPQHSRPANQPWTNDRDRQAQHRFRQAVLARDGNRCVTCGRHDPTGKTLEAHHVRPGYDADDGVTVCSSKTNSCHKALDTKAR